MSDRKYRQHGYQDDDRDRPSKPQARPAPEPGAPAGARRISQDGPRNINMPGFREVVRCTQCGTVVSDTDVVFDARCTRCGAELHSCSQCTSFDPGSTFECMQTLTARVSPKNARNTCALYPARTTVERETTSPRVEGSSKAAKAFDDLFNL
jgi:hypothetical protein